MAKFKITLIMFLITCLPNFSTFAEERKILSVQVKEGHVRSTPSFLGKIITRLIYGDQVEACCEKRGWTKVRIPGRSSEGWMHKSALTKNKIVLNPGAVEVEQAATSDEITLAGKGFNAQVERKYRERNRHLDYTWIDKMERIVISQYQMLMFLEEGGLSPKEDLK